MSDIVLADTAADSEASDNITPADTPVVIMVVPAVARAAASSGDKTSSLHVGAPESVLIFRQTAQADCATAPGVFVFFPEGQVTQDELPLSFEYFPESQNLQVETSTAPKAAENLPASQC